MKNNSSTVLALIFAFFTLLSLLSVNPSWEKSPSALDDGHARVSELGLRFALGR